MTGLLLVGGASRRFGSPKALARISGRSLAELGWEALDWCAERIAIGKEADRLDLPFAVADDGSDVRAPLVGVVAGLRLARHELCVALPVDCPLVRREDLVALAEACADAAVPPTGPLPGAYRRSALPALERSLGEGRLSLRDALPGLDVRVVELDPARLANVNTPGELAEAQAASATRAPRDS